MYLLTVNLRGFKFNVAVMITYNLQMVKFLLDRLVNQEVCQVDPGGSERDP